MPEECRYAIGWIFRQFRSGQKDNKRVQSGLRDEEEKKPADWLEEAGDSFRPNAEQEEQVLDLSFEANRVARKHGLVTARRGGDFCIGCRGPAKGEGKHREHLHRGRVITAADERREVKAHFLRWTPRQCRTDRYTFGCALTPGCLAAALVLHFKSDFES